MPRRDDPMDAKAEQLAREERQHERLLAEARAIPVRPFDAENNRRFAEAWDRVFASAARLDRLAGITVERV